MSVGSLSIVTAVIDTFALNVRPNCHEQTQYLNAGADDALLRSWLADWRSSEAWTSRKRRRRARRRRSRSRMRRRQALKLTLSTLALRCCLMAMVRQTCHWRRLHEALGLGELGCGEPRWLGGVPLLDIWSCSVRGVGKNQHQHNCHSPNAPPLNHHHHSHRHSDHHVCVALVAAWFASSGVRGAGCRLVRVVGRPWRWLLSRGSWSLWRRAESHG